MDSNNKNIEKQKSEDQSENFEKNQPSEDSSGDIQKDYSAQSGPAQANEVQNTSTNIVNQPIVANSLGANTAPEPKVTGAGPTNTETAPSDKSSKKKVILIIVLAIVSSILGVAALAFIAISSGGFGNSCGGNFKEIPIGFSYEICGVKETQTEDILYGSVVYNFKNNENAVFILDELNNKAVTERDATDERAAAILSNGFGEFFYPNAGTREDKQSEKVETNTISGYANSYTVVANDKSKEPFAIVALAFTLKSNSKRYYAVYMSSDVDEAKRKMNDFVKTIKPN